METFIIFTSFAAKKYLFKAYEALQKIETAGITMKTKIFLIGYLFSSLMSTTYANLIPAGSNDFYYRIGGGQAIPMPAYVDTNSVPLEVDGNIGLGYNCGVFNPKVSITNSLNSLKNSFQNITTEVMQHATAAVTEFPLYILARANPSLYNLINNGLLGARKDLEISTKSCEVMQQEIAVGQNPYTHWASISMGDDWKYRMGDAMSQQRDESNADGVDDSPNADINQVKTLVANDNGSQGVPWVQGIQTRGSLHAGGLGQPPLQVIRDTSIAGYNVILQHGRADNDTNPPVRNNDNAGLVDNFASPLIASNWIVNVVGDEEITTYPNGDKKSTPGMGLLPETQKMTAMLTQKLTALVDGNQPLNLANLKAVSAPRVLMNEAVIETLRRKPAVLQSILINKIAQEAAAARIIDKAQLSLQILEEGSFVPAIYSNKAAEVQIQTAAKRLRLAIQDLLFNTKVNQQLVANTITELMQSSDAEETQATRVQAGATPSPEINNGAVAEQQSSTQGGGL